MGADTDIVEMSYSVCSLVLGLVAAFHVVSALPMFPGECLLKGVGPLEMLHCQNCRALVSHYEPMPYSSCAGFDNKLNSAGSWCMSRGEQRRPGHNGSQWDDFSYHARCINETVNDCQNVAPTERMLKCVCDE